MNRSESKYFNTALRMDEALAALLEKKDFEYITVKEICDAAGVNRSTFYLHYENTRDLLDETVDMVQKRFLSYFDVGGESFIDRLPTASRDELQHNGFLSERYRGGHIRMAEGRLQRTARIHCRCGDLMYPARGRKQNVKKDASDTAGTACGIGSIFFILFAREFIF